MGWRWWLRWGPNPAPRHETDRLPPGMVTMMETISAAFRRRGLPEPDYWVAEVRYEP